MDLQIARFCNAKYGFKDLADSISTAYCMFGWVRRRGRHDADESMERCGWSVRDSFFRVVGEIARTESGARSEWVPVNRERALLYNWRP